MPHRPADTRLLTTLQTSTSTLLKSLSQFSHTHESYTTSLTAYASSSSPPTSTLLISSAGLLSRMIEEGLVIKLESALLGWHDALERLKELEEEVGRVGRDREILIGRVIKASEKAASSGGGNKRHSTLGAGIGSSSTLSVTSGSAAGSPITKNEKLSQAQVELQACEATLSNKENELAKLRIDAVTQSLTTHLQSLIDSAWLFTQLGQEGMQLIQTATSSAPTSAVSPTSPTASSIAPHQVQSPTHKPTLGQRRPSSDMSSLSPSQSASQIEGGPSSPLPHQHMKAPSSPLAQPDHAAGEHIYADAEIHFRYAKNGNVSDGSAVGGSVETPRTVSSSMFGREGSEEGGGVGEERGGPPAKGKGKHVLPRRITEESLHRRGTSSSSSSSASDDGRGRGDSELRVVENPRFANATPSPTKKKFHLGHGKANGTGAGSAVSQSSNAGGQPLSHVSASTTTSTSHAKDHHKESNHKEGKDKKTFFNSIRSLFSSSSTVSSANTSPTKSTHHQPTASPPLQIPTGKKEKRKSRQIGVQGIFPPRSPSPPLPQSPSQNHGLGLGLGVPSSAIGGERGQRKRVTSDLTGSRKLKRRGPGSDLGAGRSASGSSPKVGGDEFGIVAARQQERLPPPEPEVEEERPPPPPPVDLGLIHQRDYKDEENENEREERVERERKVSLDRNSVKGWVESVSAATPPAPPVPGVETPRRRKSSKKGKTPAAGYLSDSGVPASQAGKNGYVEKDDSVISAPPTSTPSTKPTGGDVKRKSSLKRTSTVTPATPAPSTSAAEKEQERQRKANRHLSLPPPSRSTSPPLQPDSSASRSSSSAAAPGQSPGYHHHLKQTKNDLLSIVESVHAYSSMSPDHFQPQSQGSTTLGRSPSIATTSSYASGGSKHRRSASQPRTSTGGGGGIEVPRAPPAMGRAELEELVTSGSTSALGSGSQKARSTTSLGLPEKDKEFGIPRAPGSVFSASSSSLVGAAARRTTNGDLERNGSRRSVTGPLRSALKQPQHQREGSSSRSVSPVVPPPPPPAKPSVAPPTSLAPPPRAPPPILAPVPKQTSPLAESSATATPRPTQPNGVRPRPLSAASTTSDASMESFATGRENFDSSSSSSDNDEVGDASHGTIKPVPASPTTAEDGSVVEQEQEEDWGSETDTTAGTEVAAHPPPPPEKSKPVSPPSHPAPERIQTQTAADVGSSEEGGSAAGGAKTRRRKSVRVSLQPTFSPTPPALEDWESPWASGTGGSSGGVEEEDERSSRDGSGYYQRGSASSGSGRGERDIWEDSSDEDEEYVRARRLLSR